MRREDSATDDFEPAFLHQLVQSSRHLRRDTMAMHVPPGPRVTKKPVLVLLGQ